MERIRGRWHRWRLGGGGTRGGAALEALLLHHYPGAVMRLDESGVVCEVNADIERHTGHAPEQLIGQRVTRLDIDPLHGGLARALASCKASRRPWEGVLLCRRADGSLIHQATTIQPLEAKGDAPAGMLVIQRDVTDIREPGLRDRMLLSRLEDTVSRVPGVLFRLRQAGDGRLEFLFLSEEVSRLPGLAAEAVMEDAECLLGRVVPEDRQRLTASLAQSAVSLEPWQLEFRLLLPEGIRWLEGRAAPQRRPDGGTLWDGLLLDVSERKQVEQRVQRLVATDMLTGALNRRAFFEQGEASLARVRRSGVRTPLAMLDLDHFKRLNDAHGHAVGDLALQRFTVACKDCLRPYDLFARVGGEEFALMLVDSDPREARAILERLRAAVEAIELEVLGTTLRLTVSLGLAILEPGGSLEVGLARADRALYRAKREGRNRVCGPLDASDWSLEEKEKPV